MTFVAIPPVWAWALIAAAAAAAAAIFLIRMRPPRRTVSSMLLWDRVMRARHEQSVWDRIRRVVSLLLTIVIAAAIAAAFARPAAKGATGAATRRLIVLDSSWTMGARTSHGSTRWATAVAEARAIATSSPGEVAIATTGDGLVQGLTTDTTLVDSVLSKLAPTGGDTGAWPRIAAADEVHFLTDGATPRTWDSGVIVHSVFQSVPNVAVTGFDVRAEPLESAAEAYLQIANYSDEPQSVQVTLTRGATPIVNQAVKLVAGEIRRQVVPLAATGDARLRVHVSAPSNDLDVDDDAAAWLWQASPLDVGVVGKDSTVPALLGHDPGVKVHTVAVADYAKSNADVWVFDRWLPETAPNRPALVIDPPDAKWLGTRGAEQLTPTWPSRSDDPMLDGVDPDMVRIARAHRYTAPLEVVAASDDGTPLVSRTDAGGRRLVVLHFAIGESDLPETTAFPVLVGNALDWLGRPWAGVHHTPGPVTLPAGTTSVVAPDGQNVPLVQGQDRVTADLRKPGLYLVDAGGADSVITVALDDPGRSDLRVTHLAKAAASPSNASIPTAWWTVLTVLALGLVVLEWATWQRRITV